MKTCPRSIRKITSIRETLTVIEYQKSLEKIQEKMKEIENLINNQWELDILEYPKTSEGTIMRAVIHCCKEEINAIIHK